MIFVHQVANPNEACVICVLQASMISVRQVANPYEAGVVCVLQAAMPCNKHDLRHLNAIKLRTFVPAGRNAKTHARFKSFKWLKSIIENYDFYLFCSFCRWIADGYWQLTKKFVALNSFTTN